MKKMTKKETIKTQKRMLKIQAGALQAMVVRVDELNEKIQRVKARSYDLIERREG